MMQHCMGDEDDGPFRVGEEVHILPLLTAGGEASPVRGSNVPCMSAMRSGAVDLLERRKRLSVVASEGVK